MSITTTPSRVFRTALQRMRRNGWHTVAALSVMTLTFFILSLFVLTGLATSRVLNYFEQQPQVQIYLKDDAPQEKIDELKAELEATNLAKTVHYTSKEEALAFFKEEMKDNPMLLENVSANYSAGRGPTRKSLGYISLIANFLYVIFILIAICHTD